MSLVSFISITDFNNPYLPVANNEATVIRLNEIITKTQKSVLQEILGYVLYYELENDNAGAFPTTAKWVNFVNGVVYVKDGKSINYAGIKEVLTSMVFYKLNTDLWSLPAENGRVQMEASAGVTVIDKELSSRAYNDASQLIGGFYNDSYQPSVYNYINDTDGFDDWEFIPSYTTNSLGI